MTSILVLMLLFALFVTVQSFASSPRKIRRERAISSPPSTDTYRGSLSFALRDKSKHMEPEEKKLALEKATKAMTAFTNKYLKNTGTTLCSDKVNHSRCDSTPQRRLLFPVGPHSPCTPCPPCTLCTVRSCSGSKGSGGAQNLARIPTLSMSFL